MNEAEDRSAHEETAGDRWVGGLIEHRRLDAPERVDALVGRAMERVRVEGHAPAAIPFAPRARRVDWRTPLAAAASIAVVAGVAFLASPRPASAGQLLRAAQAAEAAPGDRRYLIELEFPARRDGGPAPRASGTFDVRDERHMRLELRAPDGRTTVRAVGGAESWSTTPDGEVVRMPGDARWPRFIETPEGDLLVDRLDALLGDVGAFYSIVRCDEAGEVRLCATRVDPGFRGPERIELTLDPATKRVRRADLSFGEAPHDRGPPRGEPMRDGGPPPHPDRPRDGDAPPPRGMRPDGPPPHGVPGPGSPGPNGPGPRPGRRPEPTRIVITQGDVPPGGFAEEWFAPPALTRRGS